MKQAEWIWYPDDFEIELSGKFMAERYERDIPIPPFWRLDSCYKNVKFKKIYELSAAETVKIEAEGSFNVMIDGAYLGNAALILTVYIWLMFFSGETSSLYGETVKYYRVFETTPVALVLIIFFLFAAAVERRVNRKTMGLIVRFLPVYGFMIVPLAFIFVFNLYPIVIQTILSFKDHTMQGSVWNGEWVGFKHFIAIFSDKTMLAVIGRTLYISLLRLIVGILPSLILSICLYDLKSKTLRSSESGRCKRCRFRVFYYLINKEMRR